MKSAPYVLFELFSKPINECLTLGLAFYFDSLPGNCSTEQRRTSKGKECVRVAFDSAKFTYEGNH